MKSRSRRFPLSEPRHDDWVNGSWTVDCVCGVNFDDGEEMVDCDECGVWVHTRCSRYVKSEKSFACHKCKSKNTGGGSSIRNDSEETEVAEFLLELPMKTLRMDNPNPSTVSSRGQFRLWSDVPMDERVHVQGVPGGEPGFFSGIKMNSIFGPNLWKCTGYVPKKFNFPYTEFPCASDGEFEEKKVEETDSSSDEENANQADNGAGTLLSLLKVNKNTSPTPIVDSCVMKSPVESGTSLDIVSPRQKKKWGGDNLDSQFPEDSLKKDSTSVKPPTMLHFGKHKKEELGMSKDQSLKKKVKTTEKEGNDRNHSAHASKIASKFSNDGKQLEVSEDRGSMAVSDDTICGKDDVGECATNLATNERDPEITLRNDVANDDILKDRNKGLVPARSADFSSANSVMVSLTEINSSHSMPAKEKVRIHTLHSRENFGEVNGSAGVVSHDKEPVAVNVKITSSEAKESENVQLSDIDETNSRPNIKLKAEVDVDDHGGHHTRLLVTDVNLDATKVMTHHPKPSTHLFSEEGKVIETSVVSSEAIDHKLHDGSRSLTVACSNNDKSDESPPITYLSKRKPASSEVSEKLHKSSVKVTTHSIASYQRKVVVSEGKSASNSSTKSSSQHVSATAQKPPTDSKQNELSESDVGTIRDNTCTNTVKEEEKSGRPRKFVKEPSRLHSHPKIPQSTKLSHTSDSTPVSGVCVSPPQMEGVSHVQNKAVPGKGEKSYQSGSQPSSRGHMTSSASPSVPAMSDEELALLLHQELNSSPRVPRVPRMRHAGSLPQLTSPTATSTLMKRTSSSGGKDQGVPFRRRTKDFSREGSHSSVEVDNETKKLEKKPSSPDNRKQDSRCNVDSVSRREADGGSVKAVHHKTTNVSSSLSSSGDANGHNVSSNRPSSRNTSDENPRAVGRLTNRTLPGLIAEIMSEGKRMTYEELCNAVLPHWPHLRKHNGERYAYSSHSQAVLDCLRNRSEWARLVDRGPKTSGSRKRHKDGDFESIESEDNEDKRVKKAKDIGCSPHQEDFPKGKRKARKRRRLALQGRGVVGRRRRADVVSDDESESFSNSSEEEEEEDRISSEEEIQARGTSVTVGNEASSSSEDASSSSDESR